MKCILALLGVLLLVPLAKMHAAAATGGRVDSAPFVGGKEGYAVYRCQLCGQREGTVLAFCEGRVNSHKDEADMDVVLKRSIDSGRTWGRCRCSPTTAAILQEPVSGRAALGADSARLALEQVDSHREATHDARSVRHALG